MQDYDYENGTEFSQGLFGQTDRENGEYHFKSGETQRIYSNARYSPVGEDPQPTRYYKPTDGTKTTKHTKKKKSSGLGFVLVLCLSCAIIGGFIGAGVTSGLLSSRIEELEDRISDETLYTPALTQSSNAIVDTEISKTNYSVSSSDIYNLASKEVVSITTEYSNVQPNGKVLPATVTGSGFVVDSDGYIITNYHVVEKAFEGGYPVNVSFLDGTAYDGDIIGFDDKNDIAVIKIDAQNLDTVVLGNSTNIIGGADITIAGNPYGMFSVNTGHISNPSVDIDVDDNGNVLNMFQLDVSVYEGNSGGPVYDANGQVIGVVTAKVSVNASEGIGFALPISTVEPIYAQIVSSGVQSNQNENKASMDLSFYKEYDDLFKLYWSLPEGAFIESVTSGGAAEKCGLTSGDVIARIGENPIHDYTDVETVLSHYHSNDSAEIYFYREGALMGTTITFTQAKK